MGSRSADTGDRRGGSWRSERREGGRGRHASAHPSRDPPRLAERHPELTCSPGGSPTQTPQLSCQQGAVQGARVGSDGRVGSLGRGGEGLGGRLGRILGHTSSGAREASQSPPHAESQPQPPGSHSQPPGSQSQLDSSYVSPNAPQWRQVPGRACHSPAAAGPIPAPYEGWGPAATPVGASMPYERGLAHGCSPSSPPRCDCAPPLGIDARSPSQAVGQAHLFGPVHGAPPGVNGATPARAVPSWLQYLTDRYQQELQQQQYLEQYRHGTPAPPPVAPRQPSPFHSHSQPQPSPQPQPHYAYASPPPPLRAHESPVAAYRPPPVGPNTSPPYGTNCSPAVHAFGPAPMPTRPAAHAGHASWEWQSPRGWVQVASPDGGRSHSQLEAGASSRHASPVKSNGVDEIASPVDEIAGARGTSPGARAASPDARVAARCSPPLTGKGEGCSQSPGAPSGSVGVKFVDRDRTTTTVDREYATLIDTEFIKEMLSQVRRARTSKRPRFHRDDQLAWPGLGPPAALGSHPSSHLEAPEIPPRRSARVARPRPACRVGLGGISAESRAWPGLGPPAALGSHPSPP